MKWADLHCHSRWSDGSQTVQELVDLAEIRRLDILSITDHDTVAHIDEMYKVASTTVVNLIAGIEISACDPASGRKVHLLGYGIHPSAQLESVCAPVLRERNAMTRASIGILERSGYPVTEESILRDNGYPPVLYKQHIMNSLVRVGLAESVYGSLYRKLFKDGGPCSGEIQYCSWQDALSAILLSGGYPVLAHPGQQQVWDLVPAMVSEGLAGIELYHESHRLEDHRKVFEYAQRYSLFCTGGSDTHGSLGSFHSLGAIVAPSDILESPLQLCLI